MTKARKNIVSLGDTPWYHLINRCVRRAFLCGKDEHTGKNYEHRKEWIETRVRQLAGVFAIDIAAYSIMSNHYHIVVRVDKERALAWSRDEVLAQWLKIFSGSVLINRYLAGEKLSKAEIKKLDEIVENYRMRLFDLSWFMRVLNESIARMANKEDNVKGRFWEGRFKSQALLDEAAILSVMAYVDLNPIRAGIAETPEESEFTSLYTRLKKQDRTGEPPQSIKAQSELKQENPKEVSDTDIPEYINKINQLPVAPLMPFGGNKPVDYAIPFNYRDYCELVDYYGRAIMPNKKGSIPEKKPKLLDRLGLDVAQLQKNALELLEHFGDAVGKVEHLQQYSKNKGKNFVKGVTVAKWLFDKQIAA